MDRRGPRGHGERDRGGDRDRRSGDGRERDSMLGKRPFEERSERRPAVDNGILHFRMLVGLKKAGSVIGKGGDFIQLTRKMTGAKVAVDKAVGRAEDRLVHVEGMDEPGKDLPGIQDAVLRTAERILGDENLEDGSIKLPHKCTLRMLLYKPQIGLVMGKRGSTINEMRNKSSATIKLLSPEQSGVPIVPCALPDDEMIMIAGTPDQTLTALKMITDKLRAVSSAPPELDRGHHDRQREYGGGLPVDKRSRGDGPPPGYGPPQDSRPPPLGVQPPPHHHMAPGPPGPQQPGPGPHQGPRGPANVISMALPPNARGVLDNNDSVKTDGLSGLATVEYRLLVPARRSGVILGNKGGVINDIRNRTGARVNLFDEEKGCGDRMLQVMSTEDVQDQHCAAFDAAMDCVQALLHDELREEQVGCVRIILPHGQVGAVMGKKGATIKELRSVSGSALNLSAWPDVPACVKKGEEVLEIQGSRNAVLLATHVVLLAVRGNMARGQLIYKYPLPPGAPPPTHPPHLPPHGHLGPPPGPGGPHGHGGPPSGPLGVDRGDRGDGRSRNSRWDSAEPRGNSDQGMQQGPPPGVVVAGAPPPPGVVYAQGPPPDGGVPPGPPQQQQPQVHYVQGPPPQQQPGAPPTQVHYIQGPPPAAQQGVPAGHQVVVYTSQPPPTYVQQQPAPQGQLPPPPQQQQQVYVQGPPPGQAAQGQPQAAQQQPIQQVMEYAGGTTYVHGPPPGQTQAQPVSGQQTVVYTTIAGQPPHYTTVDPNARQQVAGGPQAPSGPPGTTTVVHGQPPTQVTYVYTQAPPAVAPAPDAAAAAAAAPPGHSGPPSASGYGGLAGLMAAAAAPPAPAPAVAAAPPPAPKARVLLTQDQVMKLRLNEPAQTAKLSALSGATITLSDHILENGAREVLLAGTDAECNTATNLMEALMKSAA